MVTPSRSRAPSAQPAQSLRWRIGTLRCQEKHSPDHGDTGGSGISRGTILRSELRNVIVAALRHSSMMFSGWRQPFMIRRSFELTAILILIALTSISSAQAPMKWKIHDPNRPLPPIVDPGTAGTQDAAGRAPSDAVVLFDGKDLSRWMDADGKPARWKVENGYMEVAAKTGNISSRDAFGDCQLHVEFAEPSPGSGESQERGNSGVFLMGLYEIQVLDSYENKTYADGQASAVYGQYPPLRNASRPPGQWQTYDIIFHRPRFDSAGNLLKPAR